MRMELMTSISVTSSQGHIPVAINSPHILLVDDEAMVRENLTAYLDDEGFCVTAVGSAEEGIRWLKHHQSESRVPISAIVDMRLPGMSGEEFIRSALHICPQLRCVIHTGSLEYVLPDDLLAQGMSAEDILHKPIADLSLLAAKLREG
jgi:CheY-like chemotaxis protein